MKRSKAYCTVILTILAIAYSYSLDLSYAQEKVPYSLQIGPRFWYASSGNEAFSPSATKQSTSEEYNIPMIGGILDLRIPQLPDTTFSLSLLRGQDTNKINGIDIRDEGQFFLTGSDVDLERIDIELLATTFFKRENLLWVVGFRYEKAKVAIETLLRNFQNGNLVSQSRARSSFDIDTFTAKLGVGATVPLNDMGRHQLFTKILLFGGVSFSGAFDDTDPSGQIGIDMSAGYQWVMSNLFTLDLRYRVISTYAFEVKGFQNTFNVGHGPMMSVSMRFDIVPGSFK